MKFKLILPLLAAAMLSCTGTKSANDETKDAAQAQEPATMSLDGSKWRLADYAGETEKVDMDSIQNYYLTFNKDSMFGMTTDCNNLGGQYKIVGDSLTFDNIACTMMACPDDKVERAMKTILPMITTYTVTGDSVLTLRADARKMATFTLAKD